MTIRFHKDLYPARAIRKTIAAYRRLAACTFSEQGSYYFVGMTHIDRDVQDTIRDEFCNYVLSLVRE